MTETAKTMFGIQKRALEVQKGAIDNGYQVYARLQDQSRELSQRWLDQVPNLPEELRHVSDAWWQATINTRESYKGAVDRAYELMDAYCDRVVETNP